MRDDRVQRSNCKSFLPWLEVVELLDSLRRVVVGEVVARFEGFVGVAHGEEGEEEGGVVTKHLVTPPLSAKMTVLSLRSGLRGLR